MTLQGWEGNVGATPKRRAECLRRFNGRWL